MQIAPHCARLDKAINVLSGVLEPGRVELLEMDLNSLGSVRKAAKVFMDKSKVLNVPVCNAGIMCIPTHVKTEDGFEQQFGVNHLAHFLLFNFLKSLLLSSSTPEFNSRVVMVSSSGHRNGGILVGDYDFVNEEYGAGRAYGQSKTANVYMANEIERRYGGKGLNAISVMPGGIMTELKIHFPEEDRKIMGLQPICKNPEQGGATTVLVAVGKEWEGIGGIYLEDCEEAPLLGNELSWHEPGYVAHVFDERLEKKLWLDSVGMVGLKDDK